MKTWYKKAQSLYRGDPNPIDIDNFDVEYGRRELGKDLGVPIEVYGPVTHMTRIVKLALDK